MSSNEQPPRSLRSPAGNDQAPRSLRSLAGHDQAPRSIRSPTAGALERLIVVDGSYIAAYCNVFLQIRRGDMTLEAFERICAAVSRHRTLTPRSAAHGLIVLTEPGALIPAEAVRARQKTFTGDFLKLPNTRLAVIVVGENVDASLLRSASRGVAPSHPHLQRFVHPRSACEWLGEQVGADVERLYAALTEARALAERELAGTR